MKCTAMKPSTLCDYWMYKKDCNYFAIGLRKAHITSFFNMHFALVTSALLALFVKAATASDTGPGGFISF